MNLKTVALLALSVSLGGCYLDLGEWRSAGDPPEPYWVDEPSGPSSSGNIDVVDGYMAGDIGAVAYASDPWRLEGYSYGDSAMVTVEAGGYGWAAMNAVTVSGGGGGLSSPTLVPGASFHFGEGTYLGPDALSVSVLGCAGPTSGTWDYDQSTGQVDVQILAGTRVDTQIFQYVAVFDAYDGTTRTAQGQFEYVVVR